MPDWVTSTFAVLPEVLFWYAIGTFLLHVAAARARKNPFTVWIWAARISLNASLMLTLALVGATLPALSFWVPDRMEEALTFELMRNMQLSTALGAFYMATPFLLAAMHSPQSIATMASAFLAFFVFMPTILSDFFCYAIARFDDLSWVSGLIDWPR